MKRKLLVILLLGVIYFTGSTLIDAGSFKSIENKFNGQVTKIYDSMPGTEDLDIDRKNGLLFISSSDRWAVRSGKESPNDGIYVLDINSKSTPKKFNTTPKKFNTTYKGNFHPHGISLYEEDGISYLYVVNHNEYGSSVEMFRIDDLLLVHLKTLQDEMLCCANDLVVAGKEQFYVTNDHGSKEGVMRMLEDYLKIPYSYLLYYDGTKFIKAYEDLNYANGVALSRDGRELYLTHTTGREMLTFDRNPETGFLEIKTTLKLGTGVDNISVDENGAIWIGAHPKLLSFVEHSKGPDANSPSEVLKVTPQGDNAYSVDRVYTNDGSEISGSSVAVSYKGEIFVGVVFENKLLRGRLD